MRLHVVVLAILVCVFTSSPARADLITIDAASFGVGVDVSHAFEGVTLQRLYQSSETSYLVGYAPDVLPAITSAPRFEELVDVSFGGYEMNLSSYASCYSGNYCYSYFNVLEVTFDAPTNYFQIVGDYMLGGSGGYKPMLRAYTSDGTPISFCHQGGGLDCVEEFTELNADGNAEYGPQRSTMTLTRDQRDIARIVYGAAYGATYAHQITFAVPEPSILLLVGLGAVGFVGRRNLAPERSAKEMP